MSKKVIISFSSHGRENYNKAMLCLIKSCKEAGWDGDYLLYSFDGYCDEYMGVKINLCKSIKFPQPNAFVASHHSEMPYQFKVAMVQLAIEAGYEQVIWCDSVIRMMKHPQTLLDQAKEKGIVVFNNLGHPLANWISDAALTQLGIDVNDADYISTLPQIMACCILFDFTNSKAVEIFEEWKTHSLDGISFQNNGSGRYGFVAHRHDQAILSYLAYKNGIEFSPYGQLVYQPHEETKEYGDDIYFLNHGIEID